MIKIFSFVGSCAGENSHTKKISDTLAEAIRKKAEAEGETVSYECWTGEDLRIDYCRSCTGCFRKGVCPLDKNDDMPELKQKFLDCDILLFSSPVYLWNMSGIAKSVLDRIGYWAHRYELLGKPCVVFSTTDSSCGAKVAKDLETILGFTGAILVNAGYSDRNGMKEDPADIAEKVMRFYHKPALGVTAFQQNAFLSRVIMVRKALKIYEEDSGNIWDEVLVCKERGIHQYVLMTEAIEALCPQRPKREPEL